MRKLSLFRLFFQRSQQALPDSRGLGHSMDEDGGHASHTVTTEERSHEAVERPTSSLLAAEPAGIAEWGR